MNSRRPRAGNGHAAIKGTNKHFRFGVHVRSIYKGFPDVVENFLGPFNAIGIAQNRRFLRCEAFYDMG